MKKMTVGGCVLLLALTVPATVWSEPFTPKITWGFSGQTLYAPTFSDLQYQGTVYELPYDYPAYWDSGITLSACLEDGSELVAAEQDQVKTFPSSTPIPPSDQLQGQIIINAAGSATGQTIINLGSQYVANQVTAGGGSIPQTTIFRGIASAGMWAGRALFGWLAVA